MQYSPKLPRGKQVAGPLFNAVERDIKSWTDDSTFVETSIQEHNNFSRPMIINNLKLFDVS